MQHMIALYYCYPPNRILSDQLKQHAAFHEETCNALALGGRIRVSEEGINGVLSGTEGHLKEYERRLRKELIVLMSDHRNIEANDDENKDPTVEWLDMKYCHLRKDLPAEKQLFVSLSVKITREVVSLIEPAAECNKGGKNKRRSRCRQRRKQRRKQKERLERLEESGVGIAEEGEKSKTVEHEVDQATIEGNSSLTLTEDLESVRIGEGGRAPATCTNNDGTSSELGIAPIPDWENRTPAAPAVHLSPQQWNEKLLQISRRKEDNQRDIGRNGQSAGDAKANPAGEEAILLDTRNIYETRVGHFAVPHLETFFPNTRKFSSLPNALNTEETARALAGKQVFMYCTGGVRCERAGSYLRALSESNAGAWKDKERPTGIYQLHGGIQKYLECYGKEEKELANAKEPGDENDCTSGINCAGDNLAANDPGTDKPCLYRGKNFVFDPRRTDPMIGNGITNDHAVATGELVSLVGQCIICSNPHDDYDNGHAPCEEKEARCCRCRVLVLVCDGCRRRVRCWGELDTYNGKKDEQGGSCKMELFCGPGGRECTNEGNVAEKVESKFY